MSGPDPLSEGSRCEGVGQGSLPAPAPLPRHLLPLRDMLGQAAGILYILLMAWPASCHCHLPLTLPVCSPGKEQPPPYQPVAPTQEARCLSPIPGMVSLPAPSFLHGFAVLTLSTAWCLELSSNHCVSIFSLGSRCFSLLSSWVFVSSLRPLTSTCLSV